MIEMDMKYGYDIFYKKTQNIKNYLFFVFPLMFLIFSKFNRKKFFETFLLIIDERRIGPLQKKYVEVIGPTFLNSVWFSFLKIS